MTWMEIILLIVGIGAFAASFFVRGSGEQLSREERRRTDEEIRARVDKQMEEAASRLDRSVDDAVQYAVEKTERSLERVSNEKIMGVSEYADTVLTDIHKNHEEVVFLYDMLNDKQTALKNAVMDIEKTAKAASTLANEAKESAASAAQKAAQAAAGAEAAAENAAQAADSADEASQIAQEATQSIDEAIESADEALRRAQEAAGKADAALRSSEDAAVRADSAKQTAGAALQAANEAILSADTARQTAGDAMKSAKELHKLSGAKSVPGARQRAAGAESQNLSGLARMQEIREAQSEAEALLRQTKSPEPVVKQEPENGAEKNAAGWPQETEEGIQTEPERADWNGKAAAPEYVAASSRTAMTETVKTESAPGAPAMDIRQKTSQNDSEGFRPFVIPRVKVLGEPVEEEQEKEPPRSARTRTSSGSRRSTKKAAASGGAREEHALQNGRQESGGESAAPERNNNEKILAMHQEGKSNIAIARELGIGVGEVKLVIDLFRM